MNELFVQAGGIATRHVARAFVEEKRESGKGEGRRGEGNLVKCKC
jgi:hypothetical protein